MTPYHYVILHETLRSDLGKAVVMAAHAAGESCFDGRAPENTHVIALMARSSQEIIGASLLLNQRGIRHAVIVEPTAPYYGTAIALGIVPMFDRDLIRVALEPLKLVLFRASSPSSSVQSAAAPQGNSEVGGSIPPSGSTL